MLDYVLNACLGSIRLLHERFTVMTSNITTKTETFPLFSSRAYKTVLNVVFM